MHASSATSHIPNVNVGGSNPLTRFRQCIALARITSHLCGVYLFIGDTISSMLFASTRTVLHRFVQGLATVLATVENQIICSGCTLFVRKWTEWDENGRIQSEENYKDGKRDGKWTEWLNGKKLIERNYKDGWPID